MNPDIELIAGPCSAESEKQVMETAGALSELGVETFRAGLWKPRTRPGTFEGVGAEGLPWLIRVRNELGMRVCTEVACADHVRRCLDAGLDMMWIGARTTANPFDVQEIADALGGTGASVLVKNPASPDPELWYGAIERLKGAGVKDLSAIFRGFSTFSKTLYRNSPHWQTAAEFRRRYPSVALYCDPSHLAGSAELVGEVSQRALDLGFNALMVEVHCRPQEALSDAGQQLTPSAFATMLASLRSRALDSGAADYRQTLDELRAGIDALDCTLVRTLAARMELSRRIGKAKKEGNVSIIQTDRWNAVLERVTALGKEKGLDAGFLTRIYNEIHEASIAEQDKK
ncbi:MAG: bifunctional 3-deoxy-7-phosphoheptulonate synthase/chorismate mutase type II [Bacteroidales bacterium]|nr:bifunctional 3-deoxy-7-phosphoheptulonate synthase/chorismate mutase type II [Bacteroidales bacterium]